MPTVITTRSELKLVHANFSNQHNPKPIKLKLSKDFNGVYILDNETLRSTVIPFVPPTGVDSESEEAAITALRSLGIYHDGYTTWIVNSSEFVDVSEEMSKYKLSVYNNPDKSEVFKNIVHTDSSVHIGGGIPLFVRLSYDGSNEKVPLNVYQSVGRTFELPRGELNGTYEISNANYGMCSISLSSNKAYTVPICNTLTKVKEKPATTMKTAKVAFVLNSGKTSRQDTIEIVKMYKIKDANNPTKNAYVAMFNNNGLTNVFGKFEEQTPGVYQCEISLFASTNTFLTLQIDINS